MENESAQNSQSSNQPQLSPTRMPHIPISEEETMVQSPHTSGKNTLITIASILILMGVAGITLWLYFKNNNSQKTDSHTVNNKYQENFVSQKMPVSPEGSGQSTTCDIAKVYKDINEALKDPLKVCRLDLTAKGLSVLPDDFSKLKNLKVVYLTGNNFTQFPSQLLKIRSLEQVYLPGNKIMTIPGEIGTLTNLTVLNLNDNKITSLPTEITKLSNLSKLLLSQNKLTTLPDGIDKLSLDQLSLLDNEFSDKEITRISGLFPKNILTISSSISSEITTNTNK